MENQSTNGGCHVKNRKGRKGSQHDLLPKVNMEDSPMKNCKCCTSNRLHLYNCLPSHLRFNRFVRTGYRVDLTACDCVKSLLYFHNESFNIFSHGLGAIFIIMLGPYIYGKMKSKHFNHYLYPVHHILSILCLVFSAIYHLLMCHKGGASVYQQLIMLDMLGIWMVTSFSCVTFMKATLFCFPWMLCTSVIMYFILAFVCLACVAKGKDGKSRIMPVIFLGALRVFVIYPSRRLLSNMGYATGPSGVVWYLFAMEIIGFLGGVVNLARIPERWFQGKMDYLCNSHNIMHLLVLICPLFLHVGTVLDINWMEAAHCPT